MRYTAIALDYDGTIAHDGGVPPHVLDGLQRLKLSGRKLLLVTGRELEELLGIFPGVWLFDRVVAENGALLYRPETDERKELGEPAPDALIDALHASGIPLSVGHTIVATVRPHETVVLEAIANLGLEQQVIFNKGAVMILPPGVNKASGLKAALQELGLSARNVVAGGDGENDHAMLDMVEYSVATANAIETLKDAADYVTRQTHGDGILEVVAAMIESDLAGLPPKKPRRVLCIGKDSEGRDVLLPTAHGSVLVTGEPAATSDLAIALMNRLCKGGYQFFALDTRGAYLDFKPAVVFGSGEHAPAVAEVLTALKKPDVQAVVCLSGVADVDRPAFVQKLLLSLRELRQSAGRPHWIVVDEAHELLPASASADESPASAAENTIYVSSDPGVLAPAILASVEGIVACGSEAPAMLDAFAAAVEWQKPALPRDSVRDDQALVWFRRSERPVSLIEIARVKAETPSTKPERREKSPEVGQVLRRA
jgi:hydroxymethylpyrimidine pyrophosphatase-like HAD family hydrolase